MADNGDCLVTKFEGRLKNLVECFTGYCPDAKVLESILDRSGIDTKSDRALGQVSPHEEAEFVREACRSLNDNLFGVKAGLVIKETDSLTSYIGKFSATLGRAIENSQRIYRAIDPAQTYILRVSGNSASFEIERTDGSLEKYHRYAEFLMFGALARMRVLTGTAFFPLQMRFRHHTGSDAIAMRKLVGFPIIFDTEKTEMILPLSALDLPIPTFNPAVRTHLMQYGERLLSEMPDPNPSLRTRVEGVLANSLPGKIVSAEDTATGLGMSKRTFARRLSEEGLSYRAIVDDLRCDLAKTYIRGGFSISEIAFYLDYSDHAAFATAFKRWTGTSPSEFRNQSVPRQV
jgi:AraC-like DNA-binding protein